MFPSIEGVVFNFADKKMVQQFHYTGPILFISLNIVFYYVLPIFRVTFRFKNRWMDAAKDCLTRHSMEDFIGWSWWLNFIQKCGLTLIITNNKNCTTELLNGRNKQQTNCSNKLPLGRKSVSSFVASHLCYAFNRNLLFFPKSKANTWYPRRALEIPA